jgi:hypothetical protein
MHGRGAVYRQDIRPADGVLSAIGLVPLQNRLAFTVKTAQGDRFGRECEICGGDNCGRHAQRLNFDLAEDRQSTTRRKRQQIESETAAASQRGCVSVHLMAHLPNEVEACAHLVRDQQRKPPS